MTVLEAIQRSAEFLAGKGVESPRLQAELLLASVLKLPRMRLYLEFERRLNDEQVNTLREMVRRRGHREPLQHILGSTSFCGLEIAVSPDVLIPRPETELLAEKGWTFLNRLVESGQEAPTALDLGTGSGCIAIALAVKCPAAAIVGTDLSENALQIAKRNVAAHGVGERISLLQGDCFSALREQRKFNLIISNPPYIPSGDIQDLEPEVRNHDPLPALDGGTEGLSFYERLALEAAAHLQPGGRLMVEFGDQQEKQIRPLMEKENWIVEAIDHDYTGRLRILTAKRLD